MNTRPFLRTALGSLVSRFSFVFDTLGGTGTRDNCTVLRCYGHSVFGAMFVLSLLLAGCDSDSEPSLLATTSTDEVISMGDRANAGGARSNKGRDAGVLSVAAPQSPSVSDFPDLVEGIHECRFEGWYMDPGTGKAVHAYFKNRDMAPCETDSGNDIAYFCVGENYHGIGVSKIEMQRSTAAMSRGLHFDVPVEEARRILKAALGSEFRENARAKRGEAAVLFPGPQDNRRSALLCVYPSGY